MSKFQVTFKKIYAIKNPWAKTDKNFPGKQSLSTASLGVHMFLVD